MANRSSQPQDTDRLRLNSKKVETKENGRQSEAFIDKTLVVEGHGSKWNMQTISNNRNAPPSRIAVVSVAGIATTQRCYQQLETAWQQKQRTKKAELKDGAMVEKKKVQNAIESTVSVSRTAVEKTCVYTLTIGSQQVAKGGAWINDTVNTNPLR